MERRVNRNSKSHGCICDRGFACLCFSSFSTCHNIPVVHNCDCDRKVGIKNFSKNLAFFIFLDHKKVLYSSIEFNY